jgi:hypothetical protein
MDSTLPRPSTYKPRHRWLRKIHIAFQPGPMDPLLEDVISGLQSQARLQGHSVQTKPDDQTDVIVTTAPVGEPISWRESLVLTGRRRFSLKQMPLVYTLMHASPAEFHRRLDYFEAVLAKDTPDPADYEFDGLAPQAHRVLFKQGRRGGPILALARLLQAQSKCIRILLVVGEERPAVAFHFDLVGGHPRSEAGDLDAFYEDMVLRIVTTVCTREVTEHEVVDEPIPYSLWQSLDTPKAMRTAARQLGKRDFFTEMVRINDLVHVPSVEDAVASQYSEGCFATWDPALGALIATVTGSARPLNKDNITEDDLAAIVGVRPDGKGALVRHVEGKENAPPSSESVEMKGMDRPLPTVNPGKPYGDAAPVPAARSKLHGHRGIAAYHADYVEFVPLAPQYYHYIVSCATDAQAKGIEEAFSHSKVLQNPQDPRQVAFTVLPGHGTVIVEKWVEGKAPFQVIWEYMDAGYLEVDMRIPQGPMAYVPGPDGRMLLSTVVGE